MSTSVLVASRNPIKVKACLEGFKPFFENLEINSSEVILDRPNADQPIGEYQTREFSQIRVMEARKANSGYDFYVGIEGGIVKTSAGDIRIVVYTSVGSKDHVVTIRGCEIPLPETWLESLTKKKYSELGDLVSHVSGIENIKRKQGAVGFFTKENVTRFDVLKQSVIMALVPFINPTLFTEYSFEKISE